MKKLLFLTLASLLFACGADPVNESNQENLPIVVEEESPRVELVFCLDATGSMSGLIQTAKDKIWDIVSELAQSQSAPDIHLGMIFYRDRGDQYVTKVYPLTQDIDSIYTELLKIEAIGGGDAPESVNLALYEAVNDIQWSEDKDVYRTIFLVGDCPPHMDYRDEEKYPEICESANKKNITVNTVKLGSDCEDAIKHFKKIAATTNGQYQQLDQNAEDVVIQTPYDDSINQYSYNMDQSKMYYGNTQQKEYNKGRKDKSEALFYSSDAASNSSRCEYNLSESGKDNLFGEQELLEDIANNKVKLDTISIKRLPDELQSMSKSERKKEVTKMMNERKENMIILKELTYKRKEYIDNEMEKQDKPSFSKEIIIIMRSQAEKQGVILK